MIESDELVLNYGQAPKSKERGEDEDRQTK
jgi:hypothetical protein